MSCVWHSAYINPAKKWGNWPSAPEEVSHRPTGFSEGLSQPGMHWLCHSSSCSCWYTHLLYSLPGDQANKTLLTEDGQLKGQVSKGLADQSNQSQAVTVCLARTAIFFLLPSHILCVRRRAVTWTWLLIPTARLSISKAFLLPQEIGAGLDYPWWFFVHRHMCEPASYLCNWLCLLFSPLVSRVASQEDISQNGNEEIKREYSKNILFSQAATFSVGMQVIHSTTGMHCIYWSLAMVG